MWKDITWTNGLYKVSDEGQIQGPKGKVLQDNYINSGYAKVYICCNGKKHSKLVHRIVAEAFLENYSDNLTVDHINNNKHDNRVCNLQMLSNGENIKKAYRDGLNYFSDLQREKVLENTQRNILIQGQPIAQCDLDGNIIQSFSSKSEARRTLGVYIACITKAANCNTISYGYRWKWIGKSVTTISEESSLLGENPKGEVQESKDKI